MRTRLHRVGASDTYELGHVTPSIVIFDVVALMMRFCCGPRLAC
jgi:hypothetical protein